MGEEVSVRLVIRNNRNARYKITTSRLVNLDRFELYGFAVVPKGYKSESFTSLESIEKKVEYVGGKVFFHNINDIWEEK